MNMEINSYLFPKRNRHEKGTEVLLILELFFIQHYKNKLSN